MLRVINVELIREMTPNQGSRSLRWGEDYTGKAICRIRGLVENANTYMSSAVEFNGTNNMYKFLQNWYLVLLNLIL